MYPAAFEYHAPASVADALKLLGKLDDAKILAGGHSLIPMMKLRLAQPKHLIDLRKVPGLTGIKEDKGMIGGSLAHGDPAADMPATVIALGAELVCQGKKKRTVKVDDWFTGIMETAIGEDELLVEIRVPALAKGTGAAYLKFPHPASRFAVVGVAAVVTLDKDGKCTKAGVGVTGAGTHAVRAKGVEAGLTGKRLDTAAIEAAAAKAADGVDVQADLQGSVDYKAHLCRVFAKRAIEAAVKRAQSA